VGTITIEEVVADQFYAALLVDRTISSLSKRRNLMEKKHFLGRAARLLLGLAFLASLAPSSLGIAQDTGPLLLDPALGVRTVVDGLELPTSLAFIGEDEMLVLEKNSGRVQHVMGGAVQGTALDCDQQRFRRSLLGIALDPAFENGRIPILVVMAPPHGKSLLPLNSGAMENHRPGRTRTTSWVHPCSATGSTALFGTDPA
jgi:glucose/arabinose dehydrogenase